MTGAVEHLRRLISIPSVSTLSNRPLVHYADSVLRAKGWTSRETVYRDTAGAEKVNLILAPPRQNVMERDVDLAFLCHTDTVPYAKHWTGALEAVEQNGAWHGCGACDVKGFLACLLSAAEHLKEAPQRNVRIVLSGDEEVGCLGSKHLIAADILRPMRMVIGEPTCLRPARAGKGYCLGRVTVQGQEAHSAHPEVGVSAISLAARAITATEELATHLRQKQHALFDPPYTSINVGTITGGSAKNIIPGAAEFLVEWRPIPSQQPELVSSAISGILAELSARYARATASLEVLRQQQGFETPADSHLVRLIEGYTQLPATSIAFGSEASLWNQIAEEVVVFGPGDMKTAHSSRECVPTHELDAAVSVVQRLMHSSD